MTAGVSPVLHVHVLLTVKVLMVGAMDSSSS